MPSIEQLQKLLEADPNDPFLLYGLAQGYAAAGEHEPALTWYDRCIEADPNYAYAFFHKARSLEALGRIDDAIATLRDGVQSAKNANDAHAQSELVGYLDMLEP